MPERSRLSFPSAESPAVPSKGHCVSPFAQTWPRRRRGEIAAVVLVAALHSTQAAAEPPAPSPRPTSDAPPETPKAPAVAAPAPARSEARGPTTRIQSKAPRAPEFPPPDVQVRLIAPTGIGTWIFRIDNDGLIPVRVPADLRLLRVTLEDGDTTAKRPQKPVACSAGALRPGGFPEPSSLLLGPGESYVEAFDPRVLCFGKASAALQPGAIVRARFGWDGGARGKASGARPYAVESATFPSGVAAQKELVVPTIVLNSLPPEVTEPEPPAAPEAPEPNATAKDDADTPPSPSAAPSAGVGAARATSGAPPSTGPSAATRASTGTSPDAGGAPMAGAADAAGGPATAAKAPNAKDPKAPDDKPATPPIVDENAPRIEVSSPAFADAVDAYKVMLNVTATNVGRRPAVFAFRTRMVAFHVDGPDGTVLCPEARPTNTTVRDAFRTVAPGGSASLPIIVSEACGGHVFRRPGLYKVTPTLHLDESGSEYGLNAMVDVVRGKEPTLVRVQTGPEPFYRRAPKAVKTASAETEGPK